MKTIQIGFFLTIVLFTIACKKSVNNSSSVNNLFTEQIGNIKINEPVLLSFDNGSTSTDINWSITPSKNVHISKAGIYATLQFDSAGVYTIIASDSNKQATYEITVLNSLFTNSDSSFGLIASKQIGVKLNEDILFTVNNPSSANNVWTTSSNTNIVNLASDHKSALISFSSGNIGTVTVSNGSNTQTRTVWLNNVLNNPAIDTVPFIFGDKLNITPSVLTDKNGIKSLILETKSTYHYQGTNDKILSVVDSASNAFSLSYGGVAMASTPSININAASCIDSFNNMITSTYPLIIHYENKTFNGSINLSATGIFTINWVNNSFVSFTKTIVQ